MTVMAIGTRRNNAELIADGATLGYLRPEWSTVDATYGEGRFWTLWKPTELIACDLHKGHRFHGDQWVQTADFTALPFERRSKAVVVLDPPYKLNGTSTGKGAAQSDYAYGVDRPATWQERHALIFAGIKDCARVADRMLLIKCQDQVVSGQKRWQTRLFADAAEAEGFRLVDMLHVQGSRPQPEGRRQCHSRGDYSTLLVLERAS